MARAWVRDEIGEVSGLNITNVQVVASSRVIAAPIETGQQSFDNKVIDPVKVIVKGVVIIGDPLVDSHTTIARLDDMLLNRDYVFYSVSDGHYVYDNLILQEFPQIRDVSKYDFINVTLTFVEAMLIQKESMGSPSNSDNTAMCNVGNATGTSVGTTAEITE